MSKYKKLVTIKKMDGIGFQCWQGKKINLVEDLKSISFGVLLNKWIEVKPLDKSMDAIILDNHVPVWSGME